MSFGVSRSQQNCEFAGRRLENSRGCQIKSSTLLRELQIHIGCWAGCKSMCITVDKNRRRFPRPVCHWRTKVNENGGGTENSGGFHNTSNVSPEDMGSFQNEEVSRVLI